VGGDRAGDRRDRADQHPAIAEASPGRRLVDARNRQTCVPLVRLADVCDVRTGSSLAGFPAALDHSPKRSSRNRHLPFRENRYILPHVGPSSMLELSRKAYHSGSDARHLGTPRPSSGGWSEHPPGANGTFREISSEKGGDAWGVRRWKTELGPLFTISDLA
jgi:hypothetical protein